MNDRVRTVIYLFLAGFAVFIAVRYFWPLLLILALFAGWQFFRFRKLVGKMENRRNEEHAREADWQNQLFQESVKRREQQGEIIDVEFKMKENPDKENKQV